MVALSLLCAKLCKSGVKSSFLSTKTVRDLVCAIGPASTGPSKSIVHCYNPESIYCVKLFANKIVLD